MAKKHGMWQVLIGFWESGASREELLCSAPWIEFLTWHTVAATVAHSGTPATEQVGPGLFSELGVGSRSGSAWDLMTACQCH